MRAHFLKAIWKTVMGDIRAAFAEDIEKEIVKTKPRYRLKINGKRAVCILHGHRLTFVEMEEIREYLKTGKPIPPPDRTYKNWKLMPPPNIETVSPTY